MTTTIQNMWVQRGDLSCIKMVRKDAPENADSCLIRIDRFALTANNITYAVAPDHMGYWNFFPADPGWGRVPVWGYGEIVASTHPDIAAGRRVYGYFPMSSHLSVSPGRITPGGFSDVAPHRQPMSPIYNAYGFADADPDYRPAREGLVSLLRPLFTTSWLLDVLHREADCFGADTVVLTSASSKTALGLAYLLSRQGGPRVVAMTSAANRDFVAGLGIYDNVLGYDQANGVPGNAVAIVDMAGSTRTLMALHGALGARLVNSCRVGLTHWHDTAPRIEGLPGPKPEFFFAPGFAQEKLAQWGAQTFHSRLGAASAGFFTAAEDWISVDEAQGPQAVQQRYLEMLRGAVDPSRGHILSLA